MRRIISLIIWFGAASVGVAAESNTPADFASAIKPIMGNLRSAVSYAKTGNVALAEMEISEAATAWSELQRKFSGAPPVPYQAAAFDTFLAAGRERLAAADRALGAGDGVTAGSELRAVRLDFHKLRRSSGLYDLSDCIAEIAPAIEALRVAAGRFSEGAAQHADETVAAASVFRDRLKRCNDWASPETSTQAEFRRIIDGAIASSGEIARAAIAAERPLVHRYLIELQSYAQLLDFRFG
ncbi:MAG: hypothetical protein HY852_08185 [Bradyrhizobium sp.]|nr:hypothetical protein [Bradyrhizobium sp.]